MAIHTFWIILFQKKPPHTLVADPEKTIMTLDNLAILAVKGFGTNRAVHFSVG
jgi:hypothetical protein